MIVAMGISWSYLPSLSLCLLLLSPSAFSFFPLCLARSVPPYTDYVGEDLKAIFLYRDVLNESPARDAEPLLAFQPLFGIPTAPY